MNPQPFGTGAIVDKKDNRDFKFTDVAGAVIPFDWSKGYDVEKELGITLTIKNQGTSSSCGGQAWAYYGEVLTYFLNKKLENRSAKFIYEQTAVSGGGSMGRDNSELVKNKGWARESVLSSYEDGKPPTELYMTKKLVNSLILDDADDNKALSYAQVSIDIDEIAAAIRDNHGCVLGVGGQNNGTWLSVFPAIPSKISWRHWVYAGKVKMIDGKKHIGFANSWGEDVGDKGWQWISEDYFTTPEAVFSVWTLMIGALYKHTFNTSLFYGQKNPEVIALQRSLQSIGLFPKEQECTGYFGEITRNAVHTFQEKYVGFLVAWLDMGYNVGPKTRAALNKLFA